MNEVFEIYFSDLNEDCQKRLMEKLKLSTPAEANWDIDTMPITIIDLEIKE